MLVLCIVILCLECFNCYVIIIDCLLTSFDILYFSTDGCINKSFTYLLPYLLTYRRKWRALVLFSMRVVPHTVASWAGAWGNSPGPPSPFRKN